MASPSSNTSIHHPCNHESVCIDDAMRPHACPIEGCTRKFKRRFTLKEHVKTHSGEKAFKCPVPSCHKRFTTAGNLSRHKRLHPWLETTYECLIVGCGCTFASETKLERHMSMVHFGQSTHLCPHANCGGAFSTAGNLKRHLRRYHSNDVECSPAKRASDGDMKRSMGSPIAVDRFEVPYVERHPQEMVWATPPALDGDLLEALGFLFESESNNSITAIV
jgi:uncharacterized Zn-finger protein